MNAPVYLSCPGLVCCAGRGLSAAFELACKGGVYGVVPVDVPVPGGQRRFLAGMADFSGEKNARGGANAGWDTDGLFSPASRLLALCCGALEQIRPLTDRALARWGPHRIALCLGSCDNGAGWSLSAHRSFFTDGAFPSGYRLAFQGASFPARYAARFLGLRGLALAYATACASSATAIVRAAELIRAGLCDAAVAGGADTASDTALLGFASLEALSNEHANPFSKNRKGVNLGEGAAFFLLSKEPVDQSPCTLAGWGESADACHMTAPDPSGEGAARAMRDALETAGCTPKDIGYVNLHGTGTPLNDAAEAQAMRAVFGAEQPPASSTKPVTGHTLGAAGELEAALCLGVLEHGLFPIHHWDGIRDETLPELRLVTDRSALARDGKIRYCMSNSFAFGGCNVSLILGLEEAL